MTDKLPPDLNLILDKYYSQIEWLRGFITDPTGARVFQEKSRETRQREFTAQLARTADFLDFAGNPQADFASIHVAGTSGKGSVVAMMAAILTECGLRTGHHISPYLQICNEKLIIDGRLIAPSEFSQLIEDFKQLHAAWMQAGRAFSDLRYGESWVILTYLWLAWGNVEWGVIETGLGGRYDPTNALLPKLSVITNINFDHVKSLGPDLLSIARHKAGIIKPGGAVVTSELNPPVLDVIKEEARQKGAALYGLEKDFSVTTEPSGAAKTVISVRAPFRQYHDIEVAVPGQFQQVNAALAIAGLDVLAQKEPIPLTEQAIQIALGKLKFPGRMETIQQKPLVILDGAHNPHKMEALVSSIRAKYPDRKITALFGMIRLKNAQAVLDALLPIVSRLIVSAPNVFGKPSLPPDEVRNIIREIKPTLRVQVAKTVRAGVELALQSMHPDDLLLVTGSLYLVGEAREHWFQTEKLLTEIELSKTK